MRIAGWIAVALVLGVAATAGLHLRDMGRIRAALADGVQVVQTRHGPVAYRERGQGPAVLALHGAGGGHDQGLLMAGAFGGAGFRVIAPSRFGYPGTPMPADAGLAAQAEALVDLLDALGLDRVAVLAMSGGVPPALKLAEAHPGRVSALALLSLAPFAPLTAEDQDLPVPLWLYDALFASEFPYWLVSRVAPRALWPMFDARPDLRERMTAEEAEFVAAMVAAFAPVTDRAAGLANEGAAIDPAAALRLDLISAPVLLIHARDDTITPVSTADFAAKSLPVARPIALDSGGHLLIGHMAEVRAAVGAHLRAHAD